MQQSHKSGYRSQFCTLADLGGLRGRGRGVTRLSWMDFRSTLSAWTTLPNVKNSRIKIVLRLSTEIEWFLAGCDIADFVDIQFLELSAKFVKFHIPQRGKNIYLKFLYAYREPDRHQNLFGCC